LATTHLDETADEIRLRRAACLLSDIAWRAHPEYRAEPSHDMIANANLIGLDQASRAYLALSTAFRHVSSTDELGGVSRTLVSPRQLDRARILGGAMRVAFIVSAAMPGVLPRAPMIAARGKVTLTLPPELAALNSDRLQSRLKQFARLIGGDPEVRAPV
jgi:exopolyphosphatase/guanosine-5'-triphosphate,3'-diphosphate pyrophosphatase